MKKEYKSALFTTYFFYFVYILSSIALLFLIYKLIIYINDHANAVGLFILVVASLMLWLSLVCIVNVFRLRYIEASEENILLYSLIGKKVINYNNIEWVHLNYFHFQGAAIYIKYKDAKTNKSSIIYFLPKLAESERLCLTLPDSKDMSEAVVALLRKKIINSKPEHEMKDEPYAWYTDQMYYVLMIPSILLILYLSFGSFGDTY